MDKICKLCGKKYNNNYSLFGTGCFKHVCEIANINIPKSIKTRDREKYFYNSIAKKLKKTGLTNKQKEYLVELYLITLY